MRPVTYNIIDCPDGRFAVEPSMASGAADRRGPLLTLTEAELCVEEQRALMALFNAPIVRGRGEVLGRGRCGAIGTLGWRNGDVSRGWIERLRTSRGVMLLVQRATSARLLSSRGGSDPGLNDVLYATGAVVCR